MKRISTLIIAFVAIVALATTAASSSGAQSANVTGTWKLTVETQGGTGNPTVVLKQEGEELSGTYKGRFGESPLKGAVKGKEIKFTIKVSAQGQDIQIDYAGEVDGDSMKGKVKFGEMGEGTFSGKKE